MAPFLRIEIFPESLEKSIAFYTKVLRFTLLRHEADYAYLQRGGIFIGAVTGLAGRTPVHRESRRPPTGVEIVMEVDDLEHEKELLVQAGYPLDDDLKLQAWGLRDFRVLDPDGYYLRITEHSPART